MSWSTPRTWTVGEVLTASNMNTYVSSDLAFLGTPPSLRVVNSAAISIPNNADTAITFDTDTFKTDAGMHSTSVNTSRMVCTVAGKYLLHGIVAYAASAAGAIAVRLRVNGTTVVGTHDRAGSTVAQTIQVTTVYQLAVSDYVEVIAYQNSGGAINANTSTPGYPQGVMTWIGF